jgi:hypothetical protein
MNAYGVLFEHHTLLRELCATITDIPVDSAERQDALDELLIELDIHMRIEDDLFYPAVAQASALVAVAHAEHRQVWDQLAVLLRTPPTAPEYTDEWHSFVTVLDAHASEEERDLCPPPIDLSDEMLDALGNRMSQRIARLHRSPINKFRVRSRKALLSSLRGYGLWRAGGGGVGLDDLDLADEARNLAR